MVSRQDTTRKWVRKFCELMDWFIGLEKVHGDDLMETHLKGLAANYLAVKLGIFDESKAKNAPNVMDRELPYRHGDWECDYSEDSRLQEHKQWRHERMAHWRLRAEQHGKLRRTRIRREVTQDNVRRYCDCLRGIMYRQKSGSWQADISDLALEANDLAVKLGLTHPDWLLAMRLGLCSYLEAPTVRELPLPWKHHTPPVVFQSVPVTVGRMGNAVLADFEESIRKAQSLLAYDAAVNRENFVASQEIPPEFRSAPLSLRRMAELLRGDMTAKKLRAMIDNGRPRVEKINRQTFVFDTRDLPKYASDKAR